ncbi:MAG TPA: FKBP-type peptidyl-prolyl cis-trans isomerase [Pedobacter sp.]|jgi:FKBP-type peptidyl-prolyl cis-trans isomerase FkpA
MKRVKNLLIILLFSSAIVGSCKKAEPFTAEDQLLEIKRQFLVDEQLIKDFIVAKNITNAVKDTSGIYYVILEPGTGNVVYQANTVINVRYTGRLLNGQVFDSSSSKEFPLGNLIAGWQIGIPKIQRGGTIRLLIPSYWAYGPAPRSGIPPNSVLDFDIELL